MRPEYVKMEAFGSYLKPTVCDFTGLYAARLFLITGPTGGGKTTILDAMSFALYGAATGGERKFRDMRTLGADPDTDTVVEFVFSLREKRYRFVRRLHIHKKRTGETDERISAECYVFDGGEWHLTTSVAKDVSGKAQEILGFTHEQFAQVIVLPQGAFRKLLLAKSDEKQKILQVLFGTAVWEKCVERIKRQKAELRDGLAGLLNEEKTLLESVACENFEVLEREVTAKQAELKSAEQAAKTATEAHDRAAAALTAAQGLEKDFADLAAAKQRETALANARPAYEDNCKRLAQSRAAGTVLPTYRQWKRTEENLKQKALAAENAKKRLADCVAALEKAQADLAKLPGAEKETEGLQAEVAKIEAILPDAGRLKELEMQCAHAEKTAADARVAMEQAVAKREELEGRVRTGEQMVRDAQAQYMQALTENAAALLAGHLADGTPCPVCGSVHHPAPANGGSRIDEQALSDRVKKYESALAERKTQFEEQKKQAEAATTAHQTAEREMAVVRERFESVKARLGDFGSFDQLDGLRQKHTERITRLKAACDRVKKTAEAAGQAFSSAEATAKLSDEARGETEKMLNVALATFHSAAQTASFAPDADFESLALEEGQMTALEIAIKQYENDCAGVKNAIQMLSERLADKVRPDTEKLRGEKTAAEAALKTAQDAVGRLSERCRHLQEIVQRIQKLRENSRELDDQYGRVTRLTDLVTGTNANKTPLVNFVQGLMLDDVMAAASRFLRRLSRGRYALVRTDYSGSGAGHRGLDIGVLDGSIGGCRKADTLSGGEQFLASLSLAFGLAEVVQSAAGGVVLDSIFIDEGFGTLDNEVLEAAMKALDDIRGEGRLVGIISHVSELKNRIPARIEVSVKDDGSHLSVKGI